MTAASITRPAPVAPAFQIFPTRHLGQPSVEMTWCTSDQTLKFLADQHAMRPYVLVVVTNAGVEMSRQLFSLEEKTRYVRFFASGTNTAHATIVWSTNGSNPTRLFQRKYEDGYRIQVVGEHHSPEYEKLSRRVARLTEEVELYHGAKKAGRLQRLSLKLDELDPSTSFGLERKFGDGTKRIPEEAIIDIEVDEANFARMESINWVTRQLARLWPTDTKAIDPCKVRERALKVLVSSPISLPLALLAGVGLVAVRVFYQLAMLVVAGGLLFAGRRGINYSPLLERWPTRPEKIWRKLGPSFWSKASDGAGGYKRRNVWVRIFNPPLIVLLIGFNALVSTTSGGGSSALILTATIVLFLALLIVLARGLHRREEERQRAADEQKRLKLERDAAKIIGKYGHVSCAVTPPGQRTTRPTYRLIAERFKAGVCQPFERKPGAPVR